MEFSGVHVPPECIRLIIEFIDIVSRSDTLILINKLIYNIVDKLYVKTKIYKIDRCCIVLFGNYDTNRSDYDKICSLYALYYKKVSIFNSEPGSSHSRKDIIFSSKRSYNEIAFEEHALYKKCNACKKDIPLTMDIVNNGLRHYQIYMALSSVEHFIKNLTCSQCMKMSEHFDMVV
jgi:hypothetical protein